MISLIEVTRRVFSSEPPAFGDEIVDANTSSVSQPPEIVGTPTTCVPPKTNHVGLRCFRV